MRAVVQSFTKGRHGSFYLIADLDVGWLEGQKVLGVHSKRVLLLCSQTGTTCLGANTGYVYLHNRGFDPMERGLLQRREEDSRSKTRPDSAENSIRTTNFQLLSYIPFDDTTGATMPAQPPLMQNGKGTEIWMVEGGYCSDTR